jgi:general secretion pathway protein H
VIRKFRSGFTLIEVMVVLAIVGGIIAIAAPYLSSRNSKVKSYLRHMVVMSRDLHTRAKLQGTAYRLVIDLKDPDKPGGQTWWVEKGSGKFVIRADEEAKVMKPPEPGEPPPDNHGFTVDTSFSKGPQELPPGIHFDKVELTRLKDPITRGKAFIHYLPEGLVDEAAIHLKGDKNNQEWTISISPLTGKAELISKSVMLQDMRSGQ